MSWYLRTLGFGLLATAISLGVLAAILGQQHVGVLERDHRIGPHRLRIGLVGEQALDHERMRRDRVGVDLIVGIDPGDRKARHRSVADLEVLQRDREALAQPVAGRLDRARQDRDQLERREVEPVGQVDRMVARECDDHIEGEQITDVRGIRAQPRGHGDRRVLVRRRGRGRGLARRRLTRKIRRRP